MNISPYLPLPRSLTVKSSNIHGLGLFALEDINVYTKLGITHVRDNRFKDGYIRTPLGGFFNHSNDPNCEAKVSGDLIELLTIKEICKGEELTVKYWLYKLEV